MYVLRTDRNGFIKYSKPCNQCQQYMKKILQKRNYYLKKIYYTIDEENYVYKSGPAELEYIEYYTGKNINEE